MRKVRENKTRIKKKPLGDYDPRRAVTYISRTRLRCKMPRRVQLGVQIPFRLCLTNLAPTTRSVMRSSRHCPSGRRSAVRFVNNKRRLLVQKRRRQRRTYRQNSLDCRVRKANTDDLIENGETKWLYRARAICVLFVYRAILSSVFGSGTIARVKMYRYYFRAFDATRNSRSNTTCRKTFDDVADNRVSR